MAFEPFRDQTPHNVMFVALFPTLPSQWCAIGRCLLVLLSRQDDGNSLKGANWHHFDLKTIQVDTCHSHTIARGKGPEMVKMLQGVESVSECIYVY